MNSNTSWLRTRSSKSKNIVHLVFVTKYRRPVFTDQMLKDCEDLMRKTCRLDNTFESQLRISDSHLLLK